MTNYGTSSWTEREVRGTVLKPGMERSAAENFHKLAELLEKT